MKTLKELLIYCEQLRNEYLKSLPYSSRIINEIFNDFEKNIQEKIRGR